MAIVFGVKQVRVSRCQSGQPGWKDSWVVQLATQLEVVVLWLDLITQEKDQTTAALQDRVQQSDLVTAEATDIAEKDAIELQQVQFSQQVLGHDACFDPAVARSISVPAPGQHFARSLVCR